MHSHKYLVLYTTEKDYTVYTRVSVQTSLLSKSRPSVYIELWYNKANGSNQKASFLKNPP
jgi:hypothetical protein